MRLERPSIDQVVDAVIKAKREAQAAAVESGHISVVVPVLATLDLLGFNDEKEVIPYAPAFRETFAEWTGQFELKTHFDRFLAAAFYLFKEKGQDMVNTSEIVRMYEKAYWKKPANMADVFAKGAQRLYFEPVEGRAAESEEGLKMWRMTSTGYDYLQSIKKEQ